MARPLLDRPIARVLLVLVCLYAPYAWLVLIDRPWDSYRLLWVKLWLILPGILVLLNRQNTQKCGRRSHATGHRRAALMCELLVLLPVVPPLKTVAEPWSMPDRTDPLMAFPSLTSRMQE